MVGGSQYKVTTEDVIVVRNHFYPTIGDKIRLEKVTNPVLEYLYHLHSFHVVLTRSGAACWIQRFHSCWQAIVKVKYIKSFFTLFFRFVIGLNFDRLQKQIVCAR
jgi:hypothetical protein